LNITLYLSHKVIRMVDVIIQVACTCILDSEPNVCDARTTWGSSVEKKERKYSLNWVDPKTCVISEGSENDVEELTFDKLTIRSVIIDAPGVDVTLDRICCDKKLNLEVCPESCIWMKGFDDPFPKINAFCQGKITSIGFDEHFVVKDFIIHMDPDYVNRSSIEGFQVVNCLNIKWQYNGIISGYIEQTCEVKKPLEERLGRAARTVIKPITKGKQRKINESRSTEAYQILLSRLHRDKSKERDNEMEHGMICVRCGEDSNEFWLSPCEHRMCYPCIIRTSDEAGTNLKAPYFNCPQINCRKKVMDIHAIC